MLLILLNSIFSVLHENIKVDVTNIMIIFLNIYSKIHVNKQNSCLMFSLYTPFLKTIS